MRDCYDYPISHILVQINTVVMYDMIYNKCNITERLADSRIA